MNKSKEVVYLETLIGREASAVSAKLGAEDQLEKQKLVQTLSELAARVAVLEEMAVRQGVNVPASGEPQGFEEFHPNNDFSDHCHTGSSRACGRKRVGRLLWWPPAVTECFTEVSRTMKLGHRYHGSSRVSLKKRSFWWIRYRSLSAFRLCVGRSACCALPRVTGATTYLFSFHRFKK